MCARGVGQDVVHRVDRFERLRDETVGGLCEAADAGFAWGGWGTDFDGSDAPDGHAFVVVGRHSLTRCGNDEAAMLV